MKSKGSPAACAAAALVLMALLGGCAPSERAGVPDPPTAAAPTLESIRRQATLDDCPEQLAPCASVTLEYVEVSGGSEALGAAVRAFLDTTVFMPVDERETAPGDALADTLMRRFLDGYREFMERFPEAPGSWSLERVARPIWIDPAVVSLEFSEESYTGGAHPNAETKLVSLRVSDGRRLTLADLFTEGHEEPLLALGEQAFRSVHGLGPSDDLDAAGFWFEHGRFRLADNFAVTEAGLRFHYNAYEVAPYSMGPTDFTLAREDLARWARPGGPLAPRPRS